MRSVKLQELYSLGNQTKDDEMGEDCDRYGAEQNRTRRDHMESLGIEGTTLLT